MADKDRETRGKEEPVAFFIPKDASSYACFGRVGHHYSFSKTVPARITLPCDIEMFRTKRDVLETDASGTPLGNMRQNTQSPLSYSITEPPSPLQAVKNETEILMGDKKKKKEKETTEEGEPIESEPEWPEESVKKKKKKKKKKKRVEEESAKEVDGEEDWKEDDEDEDY